MRHGDRFHKIIEREYERVPMKEAQEAYAAVCYFNTYKIALPLSLLCRSLSVTTAGAIRKFQDSTQGLFVVNRLGINARHYVIAEAIANYALPSPETRKAVLATILSSLSFDEEGEESIFLQLFSGYNIHRRFVSQLSRHSDLIRALYRDIRASRSPYPPHFLKFLATSQALCEKILRDYKAARELLEEAIGIDNKYVFAHRQFAWLEHDEGKWEKAAERAICAAKLAPKNFLCVYHCGLILSFNTIQNFRLAKRYLESALELAPNDVAVIRRWEQYQAAEKVLEYLSGLRTNEFIPEVVFKELRPGLAFLRALHGPQSKDVIQRLEKDLRRMREDYFGEVADLHEKLGDIEIESPTLEALVSCNLARLHYLEWYNQDKPHDPDYMEQLFKHSLELNEKDPFTHCWYGTFLKEVRRNYPEALEEYKKARNLGNQSTHLWLHQHPLFLNNIALLIMDEVQKGLRDAGHLNGAKNILEKAVKRVEEMHSEFYWPQISLSLCLQLMDEAASLKNV
jgi:tetratricopeptide (TPR) repeat protein